MATGSHFVNKRRELSRGRLSMPPASGSPSPPRWMESGCHHECTPVGPQGSCICCLDPERDGGGHRLE